jgi:glycosyltransferase involved in cell wall biosynthesis
MRIALVAPPYLSVPPKKYGGTELFVAELALALQKRGVDVTLYTNGESTLPVSSKWLYEKEEWPLSGDAEANLKGLNHAAWAVKDAQGNADVIHINSAPGLTLGRFTDIPLVYTVHHGYEEALTRFYSSFPEVSFATISDFQQRKLKMPKIRTIHHGIDLKKYRYQEKKEQFFAFLGRVAPPKGTHLAIEIAKKSGVPLKIAGEVQPLYRDYWEKVVKPQVDGNFIEYVGELGLEEKNELLGKSMALLFPIQWDEPFGLVMVEAMACGTPVLAIRGGSVAEVVEEGVSGCVRGSADELVECAKNLAFQPCQVREYAEQYFSCERMANDYLELYTQVASDVTAAESERVVA